MRRPKFFQRSFDLRLARQRGVVALQVGARTPQPPVFVFFFFSPFFEMHTPDPHTTSEQPRRPPASPFTQVDRGDCSCC